jgi:hypothetical protein
MSSPPLAPNPEMEQGIFVSMYTLGAVAVVAVICRLYCRRQRRLPILIDDYTVIAALATLWIIIGLTTAGRSI